MIGAFNSVYTALQGFFSRGFWFATFLPVALFAVLHALIAECAIGPVSVFGIPLTFDNINSGKLASAGSVVIVGVIIVGYALAPFTPRLRGLLDGSQLPATLHDALRARRLIYARATATELKEARDDLGILNQMSRAVYDYNGKLQSAYRTAEALQSASATTEVQDAEAKLQTLERNLTSSKLLRQAATDAQDAVLAALAKNNPSSESLREDAPAEEVQLAKRTNKVAEDLEELLARASREALYRYQVLQTRHRVVGAIDNPRATLIGDARFVAERYTRDVYRVDFDFLWPRLLVAIAAVKTDDPILSAIEAARSRVDFAVMSLVLAVTVPAVWLPVIFLKGGPPWLFLAIGAATPLVLGFFYKLVFEGQLAFGDVAKTAIDQSRFLVLRMLRQPEPLSRSEERRLWMRIEQAEEDGRTTDLVYVTASSPTK